MHNMLIRYDNNRNYRAVWRRIIHSRKGLDGIRQDVYQLILKAEHIYNESGQGKQKLKYVVSQARGLLPKWLRIFVTEDAMMKVIDGWFKGVKDLLDDGKVNGSQEKEE